MKSVNQFQILRHESLKEKRCETHLKHRQQTSRKGKASSLLEALAISLKLIKLINQTTNVFCTSESTVDYYRYTGLVQTSRSKKAFHLYRAGT